MKTITLSIIMFAACLCAMARNDAMIVYRNDGQINAFLKADIDSIRHSRIGLDSLEHHEYMVHEIWTTDSVYRIPLAVIDSISFVTPPTIYKNDVIKIDDTLLDYIIGCDSLTLKLKSTTPANLVPHSDDKLVLLDACKVLPYGFSGIVSEVLTHEDGIDVVCEQTFLEDLFDSFCSVSTIYGSEDAPPFYATSGGPNRIIYNPNDANFKLGPFTIDATREINMGITPNGDLALKGGSSASLTIKPTFRLHSFLIVGEEHGTYFSSSITGDLNVESKVALYGGIKYSHDFDNKKLSVEFPIPYTAGLVKFYIVPGFFGRIGATVTSSFTDTRSYSFGMAYDYSSINENVIKPSLGSQLISSSTNFEGGIDGNIALGAFIETGFNLLCRDIVKVYVRGEVGLQLNGGFILRNSDIDEAAKDTKIYERIKASCIEVGPFVNLSMGGSVLNAGPSVSKGGSAVLKKWDVVPTFSNTNLSRSSSSVEASTQMSGDCLFPVTVGFRLLDDNNITIVDYDASDKYTNKERSLNLTFADIDNNKTYTVYPKVKLFGFDILASPSVELNFSNPEIIDFKVTNMEYRPGYFKNEGIIYDFKFEVALTAEIDNLDGVADWGYVYQDPNGIINRISLMYNGTCYTDTRYAYYRNEPKSTACLYPYVKYIGEEDYYDGTPHEYELKYEVNLCPDEKHPHAIDLGLPSGTKWCCSNVGASSPEGYGGYFAWAETWEKSDYSSENYTHRYKIEEFIKKIGFSFSGTQYDAATVQMGTPWQMPTKEQIEELINNSITHWTNYNGVNGLLVTGQNGNQIFLPAAGYFNRDSKYNVGWEGDYWSSSLDPDIFKIYDFGIAPGTHIAVVRGKISNSILPYSGKSVRAVRR